MVESQPLLSAAICGVLDAAAGISVAGSWKRFAPAVDGWRDHPPEAAIVDPLVMGPDPASALVEFAAHHDTPILLFSRRDDVDYLHLLLSAGARGALATSASPETLVEATRSVLRFERYVPPAARTALAHRLLDGHRPLYLRLTPRERTVLRLIADGLTLAAVAEELFVSHRTAKTHLHNAYEKLGVHDRASAVRALIRFGVLGPHGGDGETAFVGGEAAGGSVAA